MDGNDTESPEEAEAKEAMMIRVAATAMALADGKIEEDWLEYERLARLTLAGIAAVMNGGSANDNPS
jgi:hypothetical protein